MVLVEVLRNGRVVIADLPDPDEDLDELYGMHVERRGRKSTRMRLEPESDEALIAEIRRGYPQWQPTNIDTELT
jgi:hypothetical protein